MALNIGGPATLPTFPASLVPRAKMTVRGVQPALFVMSFSLLPPAKLPTPPKPPASAPVTGILGVVELPPPKIPARPEKGLELEEPPDSLLLGMPEGIGKPGGRPVGKPVGLGKPGGSPVGKPVGLGKPGGSPVGKPVGLGKPGGSPVGRPVGLGKPGGRPLGKPVGKPPPPPPDGKTPEGIDGPVPELPSPVPGIPS